MKSDPNTLTTAALVERVQKKTGIDAEKVKQATNQLFEIIAGEINENESFRLMGFGAFKKVFVAASEGRNPQKNTAVAIPSHYKVKFTPASALAERINKPYAHLKPKVLKEAVIQENAEPPDEPDGGQAAEPVSDAVQETTAAGQPVTDASPAVPAPLQAEIAECPAEAELPVPQEPAPQSAVGQTIRHAVIEQQIIHQQIIQQQIINRVIPDDGRTVPPEDDFDPDYDIDDDDSEKYVNRCWFFAGVAVVLTVLVLVFLVLTLMHGTGRNTARSRSAAKTAAGIKTISVPQQPKTLRVAADDNLYAGLAKAQYGVRNLWPYIFSANMLRYPDPDRPGAADKLVVPAKPDLSIDRKDIELSVVDVYDAYRALIEKQPKGRTAELRKEHAVTVLICGESLYTGFIGRYAVRFEPEDVKTAQEQIRKAAAR